MIKALNGIGQPMEFEIIDDVLIDLASLV